MTKIEPKKEYRKSMNRDDSLIDVQYWYRGEALALLEHSHGLIFFKPLFVYRKGKGVGIYYNYSDLDQDPNPIAKYYSRNYSEFESLMREYKERDEKILALAEKGDKNNFTFIFEEMVALWPMRVFVNLFPIMEDRVVSKRLSHLAYKFRNMTDTTPYKVGPALYAMAEEMVPRDRIDDVGFMTFEEISSNNLPKVGECKKRKRGYIYFDDKLTHSVSLEDFTKENNIEIIQKGKSSEENTIKGQTAYKGKVKGTVRLLFQYSQIEKVEEGDIIVSPMTTPDFLPAMKKAVAVVTDEGGITCHAAIVAREFKKPTVIGTKIATQILKDGMEIEVDADNGIVKILK